MIKAELTKLNDIDVVKLTAGGYEAYIAPSLGSNVVRFTDIKNGIEFFRWTKDETFDMVKDSPEVHGLPTLYLPNRFADGILKTSDAEYHLPVNEKAPYNNHIHGFMHKNSHKLVSYSSGEIYALCQTRFEFNKDNPFYQYLPIDFVADFTFKVSEKEGLEYSVTFTNKSDVQMPISIATHTTINTPFVIGGKEENARIQVPIGKKCILNERCLPTKELRELTDYDKKYINGTQHPVLQNIDNDMYIAEKKPFHGVIATDIETGKGISYEVSDNYKFWIIWNDKGFNHYFCPEPMTAMIDAPNLDLDASITGYEEIAPDETYTVWQHFKTIEK